MIIYIAGPFRADTPEGVKENIERADAAALKIHKLGHAALCTHTMTERWQGKVDDDGDKFVKRQCLPLVRVSHAIKLLPGWDRSLGANLELKVATQRKLKVFRDNEWPKEVRYDG